MKKNKLQKILNVISPDETAVDFKQFDEQVNVLKEKLKQKISVKTLDDVNGELEKFRRRISLDPLLETMSGIESGFNQKADSLSSLLEEKNSALETLISDNEKGSFERISNLISEIGDIKHQLSTLEEVRKSNVENINSDIQNIRSFGDTLNKSLIDLKSSFVISTTNTQNTNKDNENKLKVISDTIDLLRKDLLNRISNLNLGGGSMNRKITFNGVDYLTKYTDINYKPGANVTFTVVQNNTTHMVDVTIAAIGGGGGSVRSINSISISTAAGSTSGTDYVYLCTGTLILTLPDAANNTNLYTIKNVGSGVVTIATTSAQTIDGSTTITLPVQYTSVDVISDTANWNVT